MKLREGFAQLVLVLVTATALSSCGGKYFYVESSLSPDSISAPARELTGTPTTKTIILKATKLAIRAPEYCSGAVVSANDPQASKAKNLMRSNCGVEMALLEKRLTERGYIVYSSKMLENMVGPQGKSYLDAAHQLGADILFTVNALEAVGATSDEKIVRAFFDSDSDGTKGAPASLNDRSRASIRDITRPYEKTFQDFSYGAFLDVTAVNVTTGQAIWFYKSGVYDLDRLKKPITFLVGVSKNRWRLVKVNGENVRSSKSSSTSTSSEYEYMPMTSHRSEEKLYEKYVQEIISDFATTFKAAGS